MRSHHLPRSILFLVSLLLPSSFSTPLVQAQTPQDRCLVLLDQLQAAIAECDDINSNWACYGNIEADVIPIQYRFQGLRDRRPLTVLENINTDDKGVVLMNLHLEGETNPIKAMMFGDGTLNSVEPGQHNFIMSTDNPGDLCTLTPPGLMLQTEEGRSGEIELNGIQIALASTAFVTIEADNLMTIVNLAGHVSVTIGGITQVLPVGYQTRAFITGTPQFAVDTPTDSTYDESIVLRAITDDAESGIARVHNTNQTPDACIREINFGKSLTEQLITNPGHECIYHFCTTAGTSFSVHMDATDSQLDPWIDLRGPDDLLLAYNNNVEQTNTNSALCDIGLPEAACYSIVARANNNLSQGHFTITLNQGNACPQPPIPNCNIAAQQGLNLREGPGLNYSVITTLAQNAFFEPTTLTADGQWIEGQVYDGPNQITTGYVRNLPQYVQCAPQDESKIEIEGDVTAAGAPGEQMPENCLTYRGLNAPPGCDVMAAHREPTLAPSPTDSPLPTPDPKAGPFPTP